MRRPNSKPGRINLVAKEFDNLIQDQGVFVRITPSALCPNRSKLEGTNHVLDCPICKGDEVLDITDKAFTTWAFLQAIPFERKFDPNGVFDVKDCRMSTPANVRLYYMYKIELLDFAAPYNEVIQRSRRGDSNNDILRYIPAEDSNIPTYIKDQDGVEYKSVRDFELDKVAKTIKWRTQTRPADNKLYTILYPTLPTFRVTEMLHDQRFYYDDFKKPEKTPINLPQEALIRWDYLAFGSGTRIPRVAE